MAEDIMGSADYIRIELYEAARSEMVTKLEDFMRRRSKIELVVHVDPPAEHKAYLHRSGRTARAGQTDEERREDDESPPHRARSPSTVTAAPGPRRSASRSRRARSGRSARRCRSGR